VITQISYAGKVWECDLNKGFDISIPISESDNQVNAYFAPKAKFEPYRSGNFIGSVKEGGPVNYKNVTFNPHGNGTHTECIGHITKEDIAIQDCLKQFHFLAELITIAPQTQGEDRVIMLNDIQENMGDTHPEALIIRTLPNDSDKINRNYSGANPPYLESSTGAWLAERGVKHLLLDLPSLDKEQDDGKVEAHHGFWNYPSAPRMDATITELIYVPDSIEDGAYFLNLQVASFNLDASPSKPVLYPLSEV